MGSHEGSYDATRRPIKHRQPHAEVKRVHFALQDQLSDLCKDDRPCVVIPNPKNAPAEEELNANNNAKINRESDTGSAVKQSMVNVHNETCAPLNDVRATGRGVSSRQGMRTDLSSDASVWSHRSAYASSRSSTMPLGHSDTGTRGRGESKGKVTLDQLTMTLNFISRSVPAATGIQSGPRGSQTGYQTRTWDSSRIEGQGQKLEVWRSRENGSPVNTCQTDGEQLRYSFCPRNLETLHEDILHVPRTTCLIGRRGSGDYDNLFEVDSSDTETTTSDTNVTVSNGLSQTTERELRERKGKLWLYKYNYLNFSRKVKVQTQQCPVGFVRSSYSLDGCVTFPVPTIYRHRGYKSQSFESYLNKQASPQSDVSRTFSGQDGQRQVDNGSSGGQKLQGFPSPEALESSSDEGYFSHVESSDNTPSTLETYSQPSSEREECLFITFKPEANELNSGIQSGRASTSVAQGFNGSPSYWDDPHGPSSDHQALIERKLLEHHMNVEQISSSPAPTGDSDQNSASAVEKERDQNTRDEPREKTKKEAAKRSSWRALCLGCRLRKLLLPSCLQVKFP